jgi:hypothetical protein
MAPSVRGVFATELESADGKAKERPLPRPGDGTLLRVDLKLEASLDEAGQARHDPVAGPFAADIDVAVVPGVSLASAKLTETLGRVTHEVVATTFKFAIQFVQHEVRKQRRERAPCGVPSRLVSNSPLLSTPAVK